MLSTLAQERPHTYDPKPHGETGLWWWEGPPWPHDSSTRRMQVDEDGVPPATPPYEPEPPIEEHL